MSYEYQKELKKDSIAAKRFHANKLRNFNIDNKLCVQDCGDVAREGFLMCEKCAIREAQRVRIKRLRRKIRSAELVVQEATAVLNKLKEELENA